MATGTPWSKEDAFGAHLYSLEIDNVEIAQCSEVSGLVQEVEMIQHYENNGQGKMVLKLVPGKHKPVSITLKRFSNSSMELVKWFKQVTDGKVSDARRSGSVVVYDYDRNSPVARYDFHNAWPSKITHGGTYKADGNDLATEEVVIQAEWLERTQ
jgi:phage tail-like protein